MTITWCMVPEIWSMTDRTTFCHFGPFFALFPPNNLKNQNFEKMKKPPRDIITLHMCTINENHMMYGSWDMELVTEFFVILDHFLHFYPPNNPKNKNFQKIKQPSGDIIILHKCTINDNHMTYGSWDIECDGQFFCHSGPFFALLSLSQPKK